MQDDYDSQHLTSERANVTITVVIGRLAVDRQLHPAYGHRQLSDNDF